MTGPHRSIRTLTYRLTQADALAYGQLHREMTGREKLWFVLWIGIAGMLVGALPEGWSAIVWWLAALAIVLVAAAIALAFWNWQARHQAGKMSIPIGDIALEEWGDHLAERSSQGQRFVAYETIAQVVETPNHVFIRSGEMPLVVPKAAFEDAADMAAFARHVDDRSNQAQP